MKPRTSRLLSRLAPLWAALLAAASAAFVLRRALAPGHTLASPDSQPLYNVFSKARLPLQFLGERCEIPCYDTLLALLFSSAVYNTLSYVAAAAAIAFAAALYLRRWRCPPAASVFGGLALAFSGYQFTLFNAGHRGFFLMTAHAVMLLVAIDGMIDEGCWPWFVIAAVCAVCGFRPQPDVFVLWCGVLALYALVRLVGRLRATPRAELARFLVRRAVGLVLLLAVVLLFGGPAIRHVATSVVAGRESQISQASGGADADEDPAAAAEARWDFATSWSLPPAELAELACPNLRGYDSGNPDGPYWGSLGRNVHYAENGGQGFHNFRQHTLYLGALTLLLALFAIIAKNGDQSPESEVVQSPESEVRSPVVFWLVVAIGSLVLAMGRYTPAYKLFYALPKMSSIRGPVKFLHFTEAALALLSGFGLARLQAALASERPPRRRLLAVGAVAVGAALALLGATLVEPTGLDTALAAMGVPDATARTLRTILAGLRLKTFLVTALFFAVGAAAFLAAGLSGPAARRRLAPFLPAALCAALLLDMGRAAAPYVNPIDATTFTRPNALVELLRSKGQLDGSRWTCAIPALANHPMFRNAFDRHEIFFADPLPGDPENIPQTQAARHFPTDRGPFPRWRFLGTRIALVAPDEYAAIPETGSPFVKLGTFAYDRGGIVRTDPRAAMFGALALRNWIPSGTVYPAWDFAPDAEAAWARLVDPEFDPTRRIVLEEGPACPVPVSPDPGRAVPAKETVDAKAGSGRRRVFETSESSPAGMLFVRQPFSDYEDIRARVDDKPAPCHRANRISRAVPVPAGKHTVELYVYTSPARTAAIGATLLLFLAAVWTLCRRFPSPL